MLCRPFLSALSPRKTLKSFAPKRTIHYYESTTPYKSHFSKIIARNIPPKVPPSKLYCLSSCSRIMESVFRRIPSLILPIQRQHRVGNKLRLGLPKLHLSNIDWKKAFSWIRKVILHGYDPLPP